MSNSLIDEVKLSEEFLSNYRGKQPKWGFGGLGFIVFLRTYARTKYDGTLERWDETVQRFTEGNFQIEAKRLYELGKLTKDKVNELNLEMRKFYHLAFNLVLTPPGRGIWMSGTEYAQRIGDAENNCWNVTMNPQEYVLGDRHPRVSFAPVFCFDQSMKGGGVGVVIKRQYVSQIPTVKHEIELVFECDPSHPDFQELAKLGVNAKFVGLPSGCDHVTADSREGWDDTLAMVIDSHYDDLKTIEQRHNFRYLDPENYVIAIDLSEIREKGALIKGFGGLASGPMPLVTMLHRVNDILNRRIGSYVTPTEWGDVIQNIGVCTVAGNVRRTAIILIGDNDEIEFVQSKNYAVPENMAASQWRWASNNSVDITTATRRDVLAEMAKNIYYNGEPGYVNVDLARNYGRIADGYQEGIDGEVTGFNPCGEIPLPNGSPCNLFEVNLVRIEQLIQAGIEDESLYEQAMYLAARYAYRVTFRPYEWSVTRDVVYRHRRIGVGLIR